MPYLNGQVPYSVVSVVLASGTDENGYWEFRCTPAFAARWAYAKAEAVRRFGRPIFIRTGWNIYRPLFSQVIARDNACAAGNCAGAAVPKTSSHGGEWRGRPCLAVDVDPNGLTWDQVDQAMEAAGFSARLITEQMSGIRGGERWHYIDFNAFGPIPAGMDSTPFEGEELAEPIRKEEDMPGIRIHHQVFTNGNQAYVVETDTGFFIPGADYLAALVKAYGIDLDKLPHVNEYDWNAVTQAKALSLGGYPQAAAVVISDAQIQTIAAAAATAATASAQDVDAAQIAAAVEAQLRDEFAAVPGAVADEQHARLAE